jgi:hypothetical protein
MYQAPSSPLSIGGVLDSGFKLFRECFVQVFLFAIATSLVTAPFGYLAPTLQASTPSPGLAAGLVLGVVVAVIVTIVVTSAMIVRIDGVARGEPVSVGDALGRGTRRSPAFVGAGLLFTLAVIAIPCAVLIAMAAAGLTSPVALVGVMMLLFIVPGSVIAVWLLFWPYAAVVDRLGPLTSLRYSRAITRGNWWRTAALATIIGIILMVVYMVIGIAAAISAAANPEALVLGETPWFIQFILGPALSAVAVPLSYSLFMAIYYDLRLRYEGGDLAARIAGTA